MTLTSLPMCLLDMESLHRNAQSHSLKFVAWHLRCIACDCEACAAVISFFTASRIFAASPYPRSATMLNHMNERGPRQHLLLHNTLNQGSTARPNYLASRLTDTI